MKKYILLLVYCVLSSAAQADITTGLVAHWKFNNTVNDETGVNNGTVSGTTTYAASVTGLGQCFDFDQSTKIAVGSNDVLDLTAGTITAWVYPDDNGDSGGRICERQYNFYLTGPSGSSTKFAFLSPSSNSFINWGEWSHIGVTWTGTSYKLYLNGVLDRSTTSTAVSSSPGTAMYLGDRSDNARSFDGKQDEIRIYNVVKSDADIAEIYAYRDPTGAAAQHHLQQNSAVERDRQQIYAALKLSQPHWGLSP